MKPIKYFTSLLLALVLSISVFALAACSDDSKLISISKDGKAVTSIEIDVGESVTLVATLPASEDGETTETAEFVWTSGNTAVATVNGGVITGVAVGTTVITVKSGEYAGAVSVTVGGGSQTGGEQTGGNQTGGDQTGGDQTGGDQTGGDQTGGEQTGGEQTKPESTTSKVIAALKEQELKGVSLAATQTTDYESSTTYTDTTQNSFHKNDSTITINGKGNVQDGDIDFTLKETSAHEDTTRAYDYESEYTSYLRNWEIFEFGKEAVKEDGKVVSENTYDLSYQGNALEEMGSGESMNPIDIILNYVDQFHYANAMILELAEVAGAVTENNSTLVVDVNKLIYNFINDVNTVVQGLTATTTVGDILRNETVASYLKVITSNVTAFMSVNEIYLTIKELTQGALDVAPTEGQSLYDYILAVVSSQELLAFVNQMIQMIGGGEEGGLTTTLDNLTVAMLLTFYNTASQIPEEYALTLADLQEAFEETILPLATETEFTVPSFGESADDSIPSEAEDYWRSVDENSVESTVLKNMTMTYTFGSDYTVTSQTLAFAVEVTSICDVYMDYYRYGVLQSHEFNHHYASEMNGTLTATLTYATEDVTLEDISEETISFTYPVFEKESYTFTTNAEVGPTITITVTLQNNEISTVTASAAGMVVGERDDYNNATSIYLESGDSWISLNIEYHQSLYEDEEDNRYPCWVLWVNYYGNITVTSEYDGETYEDSYPIEGYDQFYIRGSYNTETYTVAGFLATLEENAGTDADAE